MRAWIKGEVVSVEERPYKRGDGSQGVAHSFFVRQEGSSLQFGADQIDYDPAKVQVEKGEQVQLLVNFRARAGIKSSGEVWSMLNAYAIECHNIDAALREAV